ncbi:microcystin LR degradation protein MlrC-like protein [Sinorhizobium medicae]|nr:microcystin LR degradation protein MlrC-like protein [Sinorhizobium medicae]
MTAKTKTLRIFTAALATETNTFSPICIDRRAFEASLYASPGKHPETPTLCTAPITVGRRVAAEKGWILIEGTAAWADPAGLVNRRTYEDLRDEILDQLRAALPIDAVILGLHGAMVADGYEDTEGDLLQRVRELVGPEVLVCAELDPHSHLTNRRVAAADFFVFFKEFPHTDFVERAEDLWRVAVDTLEGRVTPVMSVFDCRMIDVFPTSREPMRSFVDRLMQIERHDADVLSLSVVHGFMAGDVTEMGTKMLVVTNGKAEKGKALARELGLELFSRRGTYRMPEIDAHQAVAQAIAAPSGPVTIWDPMAVQICMAAGEGAEIPLRFGAKSAPGTGRPIDGIVKVIKLVRNAEMRFGESIAPFGDAAHIRLRGIDIILNTTRAQSFDPSLFSAMDIDPGSKKILVIKSTNHFYASFSKIASEILYCSAGTPYPNDPAKTPYRRARRDIWPMIADPHGPDQGV